MSRQTQLLLPRQEITTVYRLASPWNFFLQIDNNFIDGGLIYWFAYSIGQIRNVAWGYFNQQTNQLTITGSCRFSLQQLMPILDFQKRNNYLYVASGTENKIDRLVLDYIGQEATTQVNRVDMMGTAVNAINQRLANLGLSEVNQAAYLKYIIELTQLFLETIEKNATLVTQMAEQSCLNVNGCSSSFYSQSCAVYFHGSSQYLEPEDERYSQEILLI